MEILVVVEVEDLQVEDSKRIALTGYFTMVAIDRNGRPVKVPQVIFESPEEEERFREREKIYLELKNKK